MDRRVSPLSQGERIAALEVQVRLMKESQTEILEKLDDLLALRNKGVGAFWLISMLFGTGLIGVISLILSWFKHA